MTVNFINPPIFTAVLHGNDGSIHQKDEKTVKTYIDTHVSTGKSDVSI